MSFRSERKRCGMTQAEVGKRLGVSDVAVGFWENGKTVPRLPMLQSLAKLYDCTLDDLLTGNHQSESDGANS